MKIFSQALHARFGNDYYQPQQKSARTGGIEKATSIFLFVEVE